MSKNLAPKVASLGKPTPPGARSAGVLSTLSIIMAFKHVTQAQRKALRALIEKEIGGPACVAKIGKSKPYELELSYRFPGKDWNGEHETEGTVTQVMKRVVGLLESGREFEEIVLNLNEYYNGHSGREFEDLIDTIGISSKMIYKAIQ